MADTSKNGGGLFAAARKLAKVAVKRAIERLTGMPLSGDPWAGRPMLDAPKQFPVGFPTVAAAAAQPAPIAPRPAAGPVVVARAPLAKPAAPAKPAAEPKPPRAKPVEGKKPQPIPLSELLPAQKAPVVPVPPPPPPAPVVVAEPEAAEPWGLLDLEETPETYGQDDVGLLLRDPGTIFLWWEVTPAAWDRARDELRGEGRLIARLVVRARDDEGRWHEFNHDQHLDWDHGRRYFAAPARDAHVSAHIGLCAHDGRFAVMISAPTITVPATGVSPREADDWMFVEPVGPPGLLAGGFLARRAAVPIIRARGSARAVALATGSATLGHAPAGSEAATSEGLPASSFKTGGISLSGSSWSGAPGSATSSSSPSASSWSGSPSRP